MVKRSAKSRRHRTGSRESYSNCASIFWAHGESKKGGFIRINPQDAGVPKMHFLSLEMKALDALKAIDRLLNPSQQAVE